MILDPEVRQKNVTKSLTVAKKHIRHAESRILHSTYGITDDGDHKKRLITAFHEIKDYIDLRLLLEETLPPLEDEPEPAKEYFICEHGHKHRSERSLRWCITSFPGGRAAAITRQISSHSAKNIMWRRARMGMAACGDLLTGN